MPALSESCTFVEDWTLASAIFCYSLNPTNLILHEESSGEVTCLWYETAWASAVVLACCEMHQQFFCTFSFVSVYLWPSEQAQARAALKVERSDMAGIQTTWENGALFRTWFTSSLVLTQGLLWLCGSSDPGHGWRIWRAPGLWLYCGPFIKTSLSIGVTIVAKSFFQPHGWYLRKNNLYNL
jgi:hypothetical protein